MAREFTINIPDELWVDSWENNLTKTYTYPGPDSLWLEINHTAKSLNAIFANEPEQGYKDAIDALEGDDCIEEFVVDSDEKALIAHLLLMNALDYNFDEEHPWEYEYEDEEQYDGSIYSKIVNPAVKDYFSLEIGKVGSDTITYNQTYKDPENRLEVLAKRRLAYLNKFTGSFDFTDTPEMASTISALNTFILDQATVYPWKFASLDEDTVPKIPVSLAKVLTEMPENLGE